jgi:L-alanine-DL-glutamate epimerase-like enolase superfamily enzyme
MLMVTIGSFEIFSAELPFRVKFKHSAAERTTSSSIFVKCTTETGTSGWGESLPREYVTGETRDGAVELLRTAVLPRIVGKSFPSLDALKAFLGDCNGMAPPDWVEPDVSQTAAWCAVDLALLDAVGRELGEPVVGPSLSPEKSLCYSSVASAETGLKMHVFGLFGKLKGLRHVKLKVTNDVDEHTMRAVRRAFGRSTNLRADANMAWTRERAAQAMRMMEGFGVTSFEQPLAADDLDGLAELVKETGLGVMADESFTTGASLSELIRRQACTAVSVRISKCGGLVASLARCREALAAGLTLQVGCQVGESSLISAAQLALLSEIEGVTYAEGCFGQLLLQKDPVKPVLTFGRGGRPPQRPTGPGFGVEVDESLLRRHSTSTVTI